MIAVVMEKSCKNPRDWTGAVGGKLGGLLYIDLSDDANFDGGLNHLITEVRKVTADERVASSSSPATAPASVDSTVGAEASHTAPRKLSSDPEVVRACERARVLGVTELLERVGASGVSSTQLAAAANYCDSVGANSVRDVARHGKVDELLAALKLKEIPRAKAFEALSALAATPSRTRRRGASGAGSGGCCAIA